MSYKSPVKFQDQFPKYDESVVGRSKYFDIDLYCDAIEHMIVADEIIFALEMLKNPPAYFRDNPTDRMLAIKSKLMQKIITIWDYSRDHDESNEDLNPSKLLFDLRYYPRLSIVKNLVHSINQMGLLVNLYEFAPGNYSILKHLHHEKYRFGYRGFTLNKESESKTRDILDAHQIIPGGLNLFMCFEVIEHLFSPKEYIENWKASTNVDFDIVMLSTPLGCMLGGMDDWTERELGHVRTFTATEFMQFCQSIFPNLKWTHVRADMQVAVGQKYDFPIVVDKLTLARTE